MDKVSIVTISYNSAEEIEGTIKSVIRQDYDNLEYIIVDGESDDGTREIIKSYEAEIDKWISESDQGIYDAMNRGIDLATGKWIIFMNCGDRFHNPEVLREVPFDSSNDFEVLYGKYLRFDEDIDYKDVGGESVKFPEDFYGCNPICHQAMFYKTELLKREKFDTEFTVLADYELSLRLLSQGYDFKFVDNLICEFDITGGFASCNYKFGRAKEYLKLHKLYFTQFVYLRQLLKTPFIFLKSKILELISGTELYKKYRRLKYK